MYEILSTNEAVCLQKQMTTLDILQNLENLRETVDHMGIALPAVSMVVC